MNDPVVITIGNKFRMMLFIGIGALLLGVYVGYAAVDSLNGGELITGVDRTTGAIIAGVIAVFLVVLGALFISSYFRTSKGFLSIGSQGITLKTNKEYHFDWSEIAEVDAVVFSRQKSHPIRILNPERAVASMIADSVAGSRALSLDIRVVLAGVVPGFGNRDDVAAFRLPYDEPPFTHGLLVPVTLHKSSKDIPEIRMVADALTAFAPAGKRRPGEAQ
jgi:hypothetical protein